MTPVTTPLEVIRSQIATATAASPVGNEVMTQAMGRHSQTQESVQVSAAQSDITDALEELGMSVATRGSKNDLDRRKLRRGQGANLTALGRIADYYDKLPSMPADEKRRGLFQQLRQFEQAMRMGQGERRGGQNLPTLADLRAALNAFDADITHQFVVLEDFRLQASQSGAAPEFLGMLDELRREFHAPAAAQDILAGLASAQEAQARAPQFGVQPSDYRDSYRMMLRESPNLGQVFDSLRKFSLSENFDAVIASFTQVAGADMASFGPSTDPAILGDVLAELSKLKHLRTVMEATSASLGKIERLFPAGEGEARPDAARLTGRLLHFASAPMASMLEAERLLEGFDPKRPDLGVAAINLLREQHAQLPDAVFASPSAREQQGRILLLLSDKLVEREEQYFAQH